MTTDEAVATLDLGPCDTLEDLADALRERRRFQLETLGARDPKEVPTATLLRLRATRVAEIDLCEEVLVGLGEPLEDEDGES